MISAKPAHRDGTLRGFLVERYVSPGAAHGLVALTARAADMCASSDHTDAAVKYLYSAYLPAEDTCFCLFQAASSDAVQAMNDRADFAIDRITEARLLVSASTDAVRLYPAADPIRNRRPTD
jgi:hypothetical protein